RGWPAPPAASPCTYPPDGPGASNGTASPSTPCTPLPRRQQPPEPVHRPQRARAENLIWKTRKDRGNNHALNHKQDQDEHERSTEKYVGGSGLSPPPSPAAREHRGTTPQSPPPHGTQSHPRS